MIENIQQNIDTKIYIDQDLIALKHENSILQTRIAELEHKLLSQHDKCAEEMHSNLTDNEQESILTKHLSNYFTVIDILSQGFVNIKHILDLHETDKINGKYIISYFLLSF